MSPKHPTFYFTTLALILGVGAWSLNTIEANALSYSDQFHFLYLPNGKNVLSSITMILVGIYGLTRRPRFDLGRDVLVSTALCCVGLVAMGVSMAWHHYEPTVNTRFAAHITMALVVMNASFAIISAQLPLKGHWLLFAACQLIALGSATYEYFFSDKKYLLMSQAFLILLILFSLIRVWKLPVSQQLLLSLAVFLCSFILGILDHEISKLTVYLISGHTLQHCFWALGGLFLLRFLICIKPSEINNLPNP